MTTLAQRRENDCHLLRSLSCPSIVSNTAEISTYFGLKDEGTLAGAAAGHIDAKATTTFKSTDGGAALMNSAATFDESGDEGFDELRNTFIAFVDDGLYTKSEMLAAVKHAEGVGLGLIEEDADGDIHAIVVEQLFVRQPAFVDEMDADQLLQLQGLITHVLNARIGMLGGPTLRTPR